MNLGHFDRLCEIM